MPQSSIPHPTAAELDLLRVLWRIGPADAKQVHEALLSDRPEATYATVLRQLQLMHAKGLLNRDESRRPQLYAPAQKQDKLQTHLLKDLIAKAFAGSGKALVLAALKGHVSAQERADIQKLLDSQGEGK
ncbi:MULTISPECIES: BlaI/MecI/CopY family transcriptional regulator [Roseateles]|uniref:BlaI/MecI/CopY family transcriptional regulator n=1 Tax=Roseateles albus TaxID=2987525 RepID=A0ABT5K9A3_9BURK|nr:MULTISPECIES: BlaI/MecI/CopY family transcriptional regulator [Roseateles]MCV2360016.1 BlaI/MecI/CopY family transcriptional regulator [Paucibacter sp. TC2R-5]MDC8770514.1 BlaI/MecI/CopY family transcriptional regulator [Roseateles albus]